MAFMASIFAVLADRSGLAALDPAVLLLVPGLRAGKVLIVLVLAASPPTARRLQERDTTARICSSG